jgi:hypothetical protein
VRGAEHHVRDARRLDARPAQHRGQRSGHARGDIGTRGHLGLGEQAVVAVEDGGVGMRAPDVDA